MKRITNIIALAFLTGVILSSCGRGLENSPGLEYAPDMYRSPAVEAYVDYGMDEYIIGVDSAQMQRNTSSARKPVVGTIPYGRTDFIYPYENSTDGYEKAGRYLSSPYPMIQNNIETGKVIYDRMCTHCHGEKGDGDGKIVENEHILGIPDYAVKLKDLEEGKMYHSITYGKGLMGSHASQLTAEERWQIISYIHVLQNGGEMPSYNTDGYAIGYERYWGDYGYRKYLESTGASAEDIEKGLLSWADMKDGKQFQGMDGIVEGATQEVSGPEGSRKWWQKLIDKGADKVGEIKENRAERKAEKAAAEH